MKIKKLEKETLMLKAEVKRTGFTIVELLIVIVVIGILAAISVVSYRGIQNRAHDTAVRNDITNFAKKIHLASADSGEFPSGGNTTTAGYFSIANNAHTFPGMTASVSKGSYMVSVNNFYYCEGVRAGEKVFRISGRSLSGNSFRYDSSEGMENLGNVHMGTTLTCEHIGGLNVGPSSLSYGYTSEDAGLWFDWVED